MTSFSNFARRSLRTLVALAGLILTSQADAGVVSLVQYEFNNSSLGLGSETFFAPTAMATGVVGSNITEGSDLTPVATPTYCINASGWNQTDGKAYYAMGFSVASGYTATVSSITLTSKSSATGPGFINLLASVGGGAFSVIAAITQSGTNYNDEVVPFSALTVAGGQSVVFEFVAANQISAGGGTIGSAGTFRLGDYDPTGAPSPTPLTLSGTITPNAVVPEPATATLLALGLSVVAVTSRFRRRAF